MNSESYKGKTFIVADADARLRKPGALGEFVTNADGSFPLIPNGTRIKIEAVEAIPTAPGAKTVRLYVLARATADGAELGWTSAGNLAGKLVSETLGAVPPAAGAGRQGPNAAWSNGAYLGQVTLVKVFGSNNEIEHLTEATCDKFLAMAEAARADGVAIEVNSGFRDYAAQKALYDGHARDPAHFAAANQPGHSNHQNGIAFDINVHRSTTSPAYLWLAKNATRFGFLRTVRTEGWHWEYLPVQAAAARARGAHSTWG